MMTVNELAERLATICDEISILEILEINSFDLVERFRDKVEEKYDSLLEEFGEDDGEE